MNENDEIRITGEPAASGDRCKYTVDRPLLPGDSSFFTAPIAPGVAPLAAEMLAIPGVASVLIADNVVTVSGAHAVD